MKRKKRPDITFLLMVFIAVSVILAGLLTSGNRLGGRFGFIEGSDTFSENGLYPGPEEFTEADVLGSPEFGSLGMGGVQPTCKDSGSRPNTCNGRFGTRCDIYIGPKSGSCSGSNSEKRAVALAKERVEAASKDFCKADTRQCDLPTRDDKIFVCAEIPYGNGFTQCKEFQSNGKTFHAIIGYFECGKSCEEYLIRGL